MITISDISKSFSYSNWVSGTSSSAQNGLQINNAQTALLTSILTQAAESNGMSAEDIDFSEYYKKLEALGYDTSGKASSTSDTEADIQNKLNAALANGELSTSQICKISNALLSYQTNTSLLSSTFQIDIGNSGTQASLLNSLNPQSNSGINIGGIDFSGYYNAIDAMGYSGGSGAKSDFESSIQSKLNEALANGELSTAQVCKISNALLSYQTSTSLLGSTFQLSI